MGKNDYGAPYDLGVYRDFCETNKLPEACARARDPGMAAMADATQKRHDQSVAESHQRYNADRAERDRTQTASARAVAPASAPPPNVATGRMAELKGKLDELRLQRSLAQQERDMAAADRSNEVFNGSFQRTDAFGKQSGASVPTYTKTQSGSAILAQGTAERRMAALDQEILVVEAEIAKLSR